MKHKSITKVGQMLHGADYNPDQWLDRPDILEEDIRLMKLAGCNVMALGIFSWASLEPEEGHYNFEWLDQVIDRLYENGIYTILATPSGSRPQWMAKKYPEVLRTNGQDQKMKYGGRHNHCLTSPIYRQQVAKINKALAERYKDHPAIVLWHISNEYGGECFCELCQEAFRDYLKEKYVTLDKLNEQYWSKFWSHSYSHWSQVEPPMPIGEMGVHGLSLDWRRFVSHQTVDFYLSEVKDIRQLSPHIPVTTNFMDFFDGLDYHKFSKEVDVISIDLYPAYRNREKDYDVCIQAAFTLDLMRSLKDKPFLLMESTPSTQNWQDIATLKRPGQHLEVSLQTIAHGSDSVQYFQWRKSRGASEKFHSAVVDHVGHEDTRVFREVAQVGEVLKELKGVVGSHTVSKVAIVYDWENWWATNHYEGYSNIKRDYKAFCFKHYKALHELGINVDLVSPEADLTRYELVVAPQLYMVKETWADNFKAYVRGGGKFVTTCLSGIVNENDLVYLGGVPGPLKDLFGLWVEETDVLYEDQTNSFQLFGETYSCGEFFDILRLDTAQAMAVYDSEFYAGSPVITQNLYGDGEAYYLGSVPSVDCLRAFYSQIAPKIKENHPVLSHDLGIDITIRGEGSEQYLFLLNTTSEAKSLVLAQDQSFENIWGLNAQSVTSTLKLEPFATVILKFGC